MKNQYLTTSNHCVFRLQYHFQLSKLVNNFKTVSSRLIRKEYKTRIDRYYFKPMFWSRSYFIVTVGGAPLSVLKQYIENQNNPE